MEVSSSSLFTFLGPESDAIEKNVNRQNADSYIHCLVSEKLKPGESFQGGPLRGHLLHGTVRIKVSTERLAKAIESTAVFQDILPKESEQLFQNDKSVFNAILPFPNGDHYEGPIQHGIPHGIGKMMYLDGAVYEGSFDSGYAHGQGKLTYSDGTYYHGSFEKGTPHGYGFHSLLSGEIYQGRFEYGRPHGHGILKLSEGIFYEGTFVDGKPFGPKYQDFLNGHVYKSKL